MNWEVAAAFEVFPSVHAAAKGDDVENIRRRIYIQFLLYCVDQEFVELFKVVQQQ